MADGGGYNEAAQLERTVLAWNRSSLALAANGALLAREGVTRDLLAFTVVGSAVIGVAVGIWALSIVRYRSALDLRQSSLIGGRRRIAAASLFICVLSLVELVLAATR